LNVGRSYVEFGVPLSVVVVASPLQGTDVYTPLPSTSTRNNYARPQIIIKYGLYTIRNQNFFLWKMAIPTSNSSIYKLLIPQPSQGTFTSHVTHLI